MSEFKTNVVLESLVSLVETPDGVNYDTKLLEIVKNSFPEFYTKCKELNRLSDIGERLIGLLRDKGVSEEEILEILAD